MGCPVDDASSSITRARAIFSLSWRLGDGADLAVHVFRDLFRGDAGKLRVVRDDGGYPREFPNRDDALLITERVRLGGTGAC